MFSNQISSLLALAFAASTAVLASSTKKTKFTPCDLDPKNRELQKSGVGFHWNKPDDKVYYLDPGSSACGPTYTDYSDVVCLSTGWQQGVVDHCFNWVQVFNPANGITVDAYFVDTCDDDDPNSSFGCNDIYLSKRVFEKLAGNQKKELIDRGDLGDVIWRFTDESCYGAWAGMPGTLPDGKQDTCQGRDHMGFLRCGRKAGDQRRVGPDVDKLCNKNIKSCEEAEKIAATLPKYNGHPQCAKQEEVAGFLNGNKI